MKFTAILRRPRLPAFALLLVTLPALAQPQKSSQDQLPEMGTAAQAALSLEDENQIGRMVMRNLREAGMVLDDPEVHEYIQSLGLRLSSLAQDGNRNFNFFVVRDPAINAFALPGGYVGIHSGLMLETRNESELAGVLAHEVAHVTQRHIARGLEAQSRANLMTTAAMLAAILVGAAGGGSSDVTMGAITAAQNMAAQAGINFTRDNEYEADRIGIGVLASAGFDPNAMPAFFDTMFRRTQLGPDRVPELLRTHPVTSNRIAESKDRALQYPPVNAKDSLSYALMKERIRVLLVSRNGDPRDYYKALGDNEADLSLAQTYGRGLSQLYGNEAEKRGGHVHAVAPAAPGSHGVPHRARPGAARHGQDPGGAGDARTRACAGPAQRAGHGSLRRGAAAGGSRQARARSAARPVQQRAADAGADSADGNGRQRGRRRGRRLLVHGGIPPDGW